MGLARARVGRAWLRPFGAAVRAPLVALLLLVAAPTAEAAITPVGAPGTAQSGWGSSSLNVPAPGTQPGDVMTLLVTAEGSTAIPTPAGWTLVWTATPPYSSDTARLFTR